MTYLEKAKAEHMEEIKEATVTGEDMDIIRLLCPYIYYEDADKPCMVGNQYVFDKMTTKHCKACWSRLVDGTKQ